LDQIARLTSRVDQLEGELQMCEERFLSVSTQLEQETISSRDREKQIQQLNEEVNNEPSLLKKQRLKKIFIKISWNPGTIEFRLSSNNLNV